jgi:hypothetical protein
MKREGSAARAHRADQRFPRSSGDDERGAVAQVCTGAIEPVRPQSARLPMLWMTNGSSFAPPRCLFVSSPDLLPRNPHLSERLPYHQNCANEARRRKCRRSEKIRLCANQSLGAHAAKTRNLRRNSRPAKCKNVRYVGRLMRGGERRSRTMNLAGRTHLKT